jgi:hypothetical protein
MLQVEERPVKPVPDNAYLQRLYAMKDKAEEAEGSAG